MRRLLTALLAALTLAALAAPAAAWAGYGISSFDVQVAASAPAEGDEADLAPSGGDFHQAGGHPYSIVTHIEWNNRPDPSEQSSVHGNPLPEGDIKDADVDLPPGLAGGVAALPTCSAAQLSGASSNLIDFISECPTGSQVGMVRLRFGGQGDFDTLMPLFNMSAPSGVAARFGFNIEKTLVYFDATLDSRHSYRITVGTHGASQALRVYHADVSFWGVPADPAHDQERCNAGNDTPKGTASRAVCKGEPGTAEGPHAAGVPPVAFLSLPTSCPADEHRGEEWPLRTDSWEEPGSIHTATVFSHQPPFTPDGHGPGQGTTGCGKVPFNPDFGAKPTQQSAASSSGLEVGLRFPTDGILNPTGISQSHLRKAVITLPEGMTVNPSQAEGLGVCGPPEYEAASVGSFGCPSTAKIGSVVVHTPLLEEEIDGNVYVAKPYQNPSGSLIALYIVLRNPERGIVVKLPGKVVPDPQTGQIVTIFDDLPQLPFESFEFKFREGPRAPLITPRTCGSYSTEADFYPWARPDEPVQTRSSFGVTSGPGGGACPSGGTAPFHPGFSAGTENNAAGSYSPFLMRLTRQDGEQDLTKFSSVLPPGVSAKVAGVAKCPDSWLALAAQKTGTEERESPSCPANSQIGSIRAGAGVGSTLVYVPGSLYLAGPYNGAPLSAVAIVPAVAGPFDVGTVVTRVALSLDSRTGEVHVDGERSDPIPHILKGIPLSVREIHVSTDRPQFTINPTSCDPSEVAATLWGSNVDLLSPADDQPISLAQRFQAASCASLGFKPKLALSLRGSTPRRGGYPALRGVFLPHKGDANLKRLVLRLPHSAFLEQAHIRTICTRVQFAAKGGNGRGCPKGAVYGHVKAWTPLLDEPLEGPVFLRSSNHNLPDFVAALHGVVDIEAVARIDSVHGGIRATFAALPDAPLSRVVVNMQGGKKGLIVNSRNLCVKPGRNRAVAAYGAQNGKRVKGKPVMRAVQCGKAQHKMHRRHGHRG